VAALAAVSELFFFYPVLIWLGFFYLVLVDDLGRAEPIRRLVLLRPLRRLGEISYSFYILHMPILYATAGVIAASPPIDSRWQFAATLLVAAFAITLALSDATSRFVEKPFIAFAKRRFAGLPAAVAPAPAAGAL
jgi:peptidoglycan/LPS O-acetylase OafA/YrhL